MRRSRVAEEVDKHHFLFAIEGGTDLQRLAVGAVWIERQLFDILGRPEATSVLVRGVYGLICHLLQVGGEGLILCQGLGALDA